MPYLETANTPRMYYETFGPETDYPVVLIHPIGGNIEIWNEEIRILREKGFRVIAYELRGHNRSDIGKAQAFTMHDLVRDLHSLLCKLSIDRCTLVGHSIGGQISCIYAATYPEKVDNLIIISSSSEIIPDADLEKHHMTREIARTKGMMALAEETMQEHEVAKNAFKNGKKRETFTRIFTKTSIEGFAAATVALYSIPDNTTELLKSNSNLRLFGIVGSDDEVFVRLMTQMQKQIPAMKIEIVGGGDHWLIVENHKAFDEAFMEALDNTILLPKKVV
ncbi:MAG: alpha/beta hydrolase, partial [Thermoproteota archaeon]